MRATTENLEHALSSLTIATTSSLQEGVPITTPPASAALSSLAITTSNSSDDGVRIRTPSTSTNSATTEDDQPTRYFDQFAGFVPNHKAPLLEEFRRLADFMDWRIGRKKGSKDKKGGKRELGGTKFKEEWLACCRMEYDYWYGKITRDNLVAWQGLCLDIAGVSDPPASITKCKKLMSSFYVNIYDYINCKRAEVAIQPIFKNYWKFLKRTRNGMVFPLETAKTDKSHRGLLQTVFA